jgi:transposase
LYVGLDLSRKRLDWHALGGKGELIGEGACPPDRDALAHLAYRFDRDWRQPVQAAIESMTGARFVHDQLELVGWDVRIADAQRAKGIAPLACKTDRIDAWVLAELARRDLIPESGCRGPRCGAIEQELRRLGAEHRYLRLLMSAPGIGWVLGYTIAAEIGDIDRFATPARLISYTGLCPRVRQSGEVDRRGALSKHGPPYLRWALIEAAHNAIRCHPPYRELADRQRARLGKQRGGSVAAITIARKLAEASWWMLTCNRLFAPAGARVPLTA